MKPTEIAGDGLLLRLWQPSDVDGVLRAVDDPDIRRWLGLPVDRAACAEFLLDAVPRKWDEETGAHLGVFDAASGELLGAAGLADLDLPGRYAEIGFWTAPWARGRRVAERAARLLITWAFDQLEVELIRWHARVGNHPSRLVALRLGFVMEGTGRSRRADRDGRRFDRWAGSLTPSALRAAGAPDSPAIALAARRAKIFGGPQPSLTGPGGVRLRPARETDVDALALACADPEAVRWTTVPTPYTRADAESFALSHLPAQWRAGASAGFVIAGPDDAYAGTIELRLVSATDPGFADVGYMVAPQARGRGYAPAALRTVAEWGIAALGLQRVEWLAHVGNHASRRVAEKAGFTIEGVRRSGIPHRGERRDVWAGALLATDVAGRQEVVA